MTEKELDAKIDRAHKELHNGKYTEFSDVNEMNQWLDSLWFFGMYKIRYSDQAKENLTRLKRSEPKAFEKVKKFLAELMVLLIWGLAILSLSKEIVRDNGLEL